MVSADSLRLFVFKGSYPTFQYHFAAVKKFYVYSNISISHFVSKQNITSIIIKLGKMGIICGGKKCMSTYNVWIQVLMKTSELERILTNLRLKVSIFNQNFYVSPLTSFSSQGNLCSPTGVVVTGWKSSNENKFHADILTNQICFQHFSWKQYTF